MLTHNNHFKFGYDRKWFIPRTSPDQRYTVEFGKCSKVADWRTECIVAAELIARSTDHPIHLLFSGGIDSEVAVLSFLAAGISITVDIMRFENGYNDHDIIYAIEFCERHNVPYQLHKLDVLKFFDGPMYDYAAISHCVSPQLCTTMWLIDQIDGYVIIGQGECVLVQENDEWFFRESEKINAWYRYYLETGKVGAPGFHQYTPEQMLSFLLDPTFIPYMQSGKTSNKSVKYETYRRYFDIQKRPKYTGFEFLEQADQHHRRKLLDLYGDWNDFTLFRYPDILMSLYANTEL